MASTRDSKTDCQRNIWQNPCKKSRFWNSFFPVTVRTSANSLFAHGSIERLASTCPEIRQITQGSTINKLVIMPIGITIHMREKSIFQWSLFVITFRWPRESLSQEFNNDTTDDVPIRNTSQRCVSALPQDGILAVFPHADVISRREVWPPPKPSFVYVEKAVIILN